MNIELFEKQTANVFLNLQTEFDDFEVYGGTTKEQFSVTEIGNKKWQVIVPQQSVQNCWAVKYDIFARRKSTGYEWLILSGKIDTKRRYSDVSGSSVSAVEYHVDIPIVEDNKEIVGRTILVGIKGEKGDPFTYDDLTPEQLNELKTEIVNPDQTFNATSTNAQSGVAVNDAFSKKGVRLKNGTINLVSKHTNGVTTTIYIWDTTLAAGTSLKNFDRGVTLGCNAHGYYGATTVGLGATSSGYYSSAYGIDTKAGGMGSIAIGSSSQTTAHMSTAIGLATVVKDTGVAAISCNTNINWTSTGETNIQTLFYIIGATTPLANKYENGAACLGYVVKKKDGTVLECGTRKLSEIFTNNTAFAPTDLETEATPFMPTGITDPIEFPEEPEEVTEQ